MARLVRTILVLVVLAGAVYVAARLLRRRAGGWPAAEPAWIPPEVEPAPAVVVEEEAADLQQEIADAEAEGMRAPDWEPAIDVAIDETGHVVEPEPPAKEAVIEEPAEGPAAEPPGAAEELARAIADAEAEGMPPPPAEAPPPPMPHDDEDVVLSRFEELAATPEPPGAAAGVELARAITDAEGEGMAPPPGAPPVDEARDAAGEPLIASVEEALEEMAPPPIRPPQRRSAESYLDEGNVYFNVGQFALAIDRYTQAIALDPGLASAYYNRANAYTRSGEFDRALADYNRALELAPRDPDAHNNRGMLHLYRGNYAEALADFNAALELDPGDTTVLVNRGLAHLHGGDAASALVDFLAAAAQDKGDAAAHYGAAQASAVLGNREEALRHVRAAIALDPAYAREAAADPRLAILQGDHEFLAILREAGRSPSP